MDGIRTDIFTQISNTLTLLTYGTYTIHIPNGISNAPRYAESKQQL